jgi:NAD(P)-dependent dehydrogenase (short-subunit alcohol dehydrogenase family)
MAGVQTLIVCAYIISFIIICNVTTTSWIDVVNGFATTRPTSFRRSTTIQSYNNNVNNNLLVISNNKSNSNRIQIRTIQRQTRVGLCPDGVDNHRNDKKDDDDIDAKGIQEENNIQTMTHTNQDNDIMKSNRRVWNRRESIIIAASTTMSGLLTPFLYQVNPGLAAETMDMGTTTMSSSNTNRIIVMTGANSGIGFESCQRIATSQPGTVIVLACRTLAKAKDAIQRISQSTSSNAADGVIMATLIPAECNLANLQSIRQFSEDLPKLLSEYNTNNNNNKKPPKINVLALNAGIARNVNAKECVRTDDGFELTIGTNHFGHFYLLHLLFPLLQMKGDDSGSSSTIVVTASSVHDPASPGGAQGETATLGELQGLIEQGVECEMIDGRPFNADKAYKDSKVRNYFVS